MLLGPTSDSHLIVLEHVLVRETVLPKSRYTRTLSEERCASRPLVCTGSCSRMINARKQQLSSLALVAYEQEHAFSTERDMFPGHDSCPVLSTAAPS